MTHEHFYHQDTGDRLDTLDEIYYQTQSKLQQLAGDVSTLHQENPSNYFGFTRLMQRGNQLLELSQLVVGISERDGHQPVMIHLDDTERRLIEKPEMLMPDSLSPISSKDVHEADRLGIEDGTADFLSMLVPSSEQDEGIRQIYFSRWERQLFRQKFPFTQEEKDGSGSLSLATILPNVDIEYLYRAANKLPRRTIRINSISYH